MTGAQLISFARGAPSLDIVDVDGLKSAAVRAFEADPAGMTAYGTSVGYPPLREWIAAKHGVDVDRVLVTNGSLQADALLFDQLLRPGDEVVVERPTYDRTLLNLRSLGTTVHQVTLEPDGIDVDDLRKRLLDGVRPVLAHIIPNFQNPAGVTLSPQKRRALLALAREYRFVIFEDDPYAEIRFRGPALPSMLSLDLAERGSDADTVVHASSFTKTVCPGLRVGYLVGPPPLIAAIAARATRLYISPGMVAQGIVHQFCVSGAIDESIRSVRAALWERARLLTEALARHIPQARFREPDGGYFLWLELPADVTAARLVPVAEAHGVAVVNGSDFLIEGGEHALRLAYSAVRPDEVDEGVRRLAAAIEAVRAGGARESAG